MVDRWHPTSDSIMLIAKHPGGDYVRHSDYAALEAQLAEAAKERDEALEELGKVIMACPVGQRSMPISRTVASMRARLSALEAAPPAPKVTEGALPQDVIDLVIAAREYWDANDDLSPESRALDKALEEFASRVPYADEPGSLTAAQESGQ